MYPNNYYKALVAKISFLFFANTAIAQGVSKNLDLGEVGCLAPDITTPTSDYDSWHGYQSSFLTVIELDDDSL
jgi:hypothetical protein